MNIVTHTAPDFDAIASCWLLQRHGKMDTAIVQFVNTGNPDAELIESAAAVVDTGRIFNPDRLRFDHHHFPGASANDTCAAWQVYEHLLAAQPDLDYLAPMIDLIYAGDTGKSAASASRAFGIHALLSAKKARRASNDELLAFGYELLDLLAERAKTQSIAAAELAQKIVYRSDDGLIVAIKDGNPGSTFAAFDQGARLVLFQSTYPETNAIGIQRGGEQQEPHIGRLITAALQEAALQEMEYHSTNNSDMYAELATWFRHEAGFFAGRGTQKAPDPRPVLVELSAIAAIIDRTWER